MMTKQHEFDEKLARLRRWMSDQKVGAVVLRRRPNFAWITCGGRSHINTAADVGCAGVLVTASRLAVIANSIEAQRLAEEELAGLVVEVLSFPWHEPQKQQPLIEQLAGGAVVSDTDSDGTVEAALKNMRATLLAPEIERLRALGRATTRIVEETCRRLEPGWSEERVAGEVHVLAAAEEARAPVCLIAADERIVKRRHPLPTNLAVRHRAMVVVCIERHGLICSATRLVSFGANDGQLQQRHEAVCAVDAAAINATRVDRPLCDIFAQVVDAYCTQGFADEWRQHHQGGTSGYMPRETVANPSAQTRVQPYQVVAWNPSIAGTKSEDTILTTPDGFEWITAPGEGWPTIEVTIGQVQLSRAAWLTRG